MFFINTRPQQNNQTLSQALIQHGLSVIDFPILQLDALPLQDDFKIQFQQFIDADIVVAVSPIAVQIGIQYSQHYFGQNWLEILQKKQWIAVGKATQNSLKTWQINSISPHLETSEGMLDLPIFQTLKVNPLNLKNKPIVAIWRGIGGRTFLMQQLQQYGCTILNMRLYQRVLPNYSTAELQHLYAHLPAWVLISSEQSWHNWKMILNRQFDGLNTTELDKLTQLWQNSYLILGERVRQIVDAEFAQYPQPQNLMSARITVADLRHDTLLQAMRIS